MQVLKKLFEENIDCISTVVLNAIHSWHREIRLTVEHFLAQD
jgi:hypothetical protein